jgi:hypothetical protein
MKYASILITAISFLVFGWGLVEVSRQVSSPGSARAGAMAAQVDLSQEVESAENAAKNLPHLQAMIASGASPSQLLAVGKPASGEQTGEPLAKLTMIYFSPSFRRAAIDGRIVKAGQTLDDGSKVISVERDRVVVLNAAGRSTLTIPQDRIRIGSVHK